MRIAAFAALFWLILLAAINVTAADSNVDIRSTSLQILERTGDIRFEGDVEVRMSGIVLRCDMLTVKADTADANKIVSGKASGNVVLTRAGERITAGEAVFDLESGKVELTGTPSLTREDTTIEAQGIVYSISEGTASFKGPVRALFKAPGE